MRLAPPAGLRLQHLIPDQDALLLAILGRENMPEVDAQARARLKQEAARTALLDSEIAQVLSAVAALASLFSPPHAAVLGIGSAAMGQCGNYRQSIANDPPRDDFDQVSITQARVNEDLVPVDEPKRTFYLFAAQHLILSDALFALLLSLERYDGAVNANNLDAASSQADAARQNAAAAVSIQESLPPLVHALNDGWHTLSAGSSLTFADLSLEQVQQFYREAWGSPP